jgi:hypothetical protein
LEISYLGHTISAISMLGGGREKVKRGKREGEKVKKVE